jgi:hypothetical protein
VDSRDRLNQLKGNNGSKSRREGEGYLISYGKLSKVLFGTMDDDDAKYYNEQIKLFEQNSEDMTSLMK